MLARQRLDYCILIYYFWAEYFFHVSFFNLNNIQLYEAHMYRIVRRRVMAGGDIILNEIEAPKIARIAKPGEFP